MATSGSYNFSIDRDTLIKESLEILNAYDPISTPTADEIFSCARTLNLMLKSWAMYGLELWKMEEVHLFLQADQIKYTLSSTGDYATTSHTETAVKTTASATDTSIDVDSTTGMTAADFILIELDDGTMHQTTISSVTDSDTVVITDAIPTGKSAAADNVVYFFTNKVQKPLAITDAFVRYNTTGNDVSLDIISREEYWDLGVKTTEGVPNLLYFDPRRDTSEVRVYPEPSDITNYLVLICQYPFEDFDAATNTPDFPQQWYEAVVWNLAVRLMYKFGATVPMDRRREIQGMAKMMLEEALAHDTERTSIYFQPEKR